MGVEQDLLNHITSLPESKLQHVRGNPGEVLKLIEEFPASLMVVGPNKGKVIRDRMAKVQPQVMIELGCFVGYSAILFGQDVAKVGGKYYSFELTQERADVASKLIDLAGLSDTVDIIVGPTKSTLPQFNDILSKDSPLKPFRPIDFIFIDHAKDLYVPDFRMLECLNLIGIGTVIAADNIVRPGVPEYHQYVNLTPQQRHDYNNQVPNPEGSVYIGRWNILYESELVPVDQDAVEFTTCVKYLNT